MYHTVEVPKNEANLEVKLTKMRWVIIAIFSFLAAASAIQWVQYSIIANIIMEYYGVTSVAVDWTSMICMATYPVLIIPATYLIDKIGFRHCLLMGASGTAIGSWIKIFSVAPHLFWVSFMGQTVVFISQVFILGTPTVAAAIWFGPDEVATACAIGVFGTQAGTALSFMLPPLIVKSHGNLDYIGRELSYLFYGTCAFTTLILPLVFFFFEAQPKHPPSIVQAQIRSRKVEFSNEEFWKSYKSLFTNKPFLLLTISYGINVGVFVALCTMLNQFILSYFENAEKDAGAIGMLLIISGLMGVVAFGLILDRTKRFKETTLGLYIMTTCGVIAFMVALETYNKVFVYIAAVILGLFQTAYYSIGFECGVELSFPQPESSSTGVLLSMSQICGIIFTLLLGELLARVGTFWALSSMVGFLVLGSIITIFIPNIKLRQKALEVKVLEKKAFLSKDDA